MITFTIMFSKVRHCAFNKFKKAHKILDYFQSVKHQKNVIDVIVYSKIFYKQQIQHYFGPTFQNFQFRMIIFFKGTVSIRENSDD